LTSSPSLEDATRLEAINFASLIFFAYRLAERQTTCEAAGNDTIIRQA
jgi:hypothetical protein